MKKKLSVIAILCIAILFVIPTLFYGKLNHSSMIMSVGDSAELKINNPIMQMMASYDSSDGNIAVVENEGSVAAYTPGTTTVEVKSFLRTFTCKVSVLGFEEEELNLLSGKRVPIAIEGASDRAVFRSDNEEVVSVKDGMLVANNNGTAIVTCDDHGVLATQLVRVAGILSKEPYVFSGNAMSLSVNTDVVGNVQTWQVSDGTVATIDADGVLTGEAPGTAEITCVTDRDEVLTTTINVVGMKNDVSYLQQGDQLPIQLTSGQGFAADGIEWKTSNADVASVDMFGNITALNSGEAEISGTMDGQTVVGKINVMTLPEKAFTAVGLSSDIAVANSDNDVAWASSDESKVKVVDGKLQGVSTGTATVTATTHDRTFTCDVAVVKMSADSVKMNTEGTKSLKVEGGSGEVPQWSSKDENVATVSDTGKITPVGAGTTEVVCTMGESTISIPVTIDAIPEKEPEEKAEETRAEPEAEETKAPEEPVKEETKEEPKEEPKETEKPAVKKVAAKEPEYKPNTGGAYTPAQAMIACGDYYNSALQAARKNGEKWVYSNSSKYVVQTGTFEDMLKGKIRGGNCASIANWAFHDMGILSGKQKFYGDGNGKIRNYNAGGTSVKATLDKYCDVINVEKENKSFGTLLKEGKIQVGDVIIGKGHTYVYRGNGTVYASGHDAKWHKDSSVKTDDSNKAVFENWIKNYKGTYDERFKVHFIIHVKDSYVPKYYRDGSGNLVNNK